MKHYILIADASRARLFVAGSVRGPLTLERQISFPLGRALEQQIVTDEPGRLRKGGARGVLSAMDPKTTAHESEAKHFATHLARMLSDLRLEPVDTLAIAAPPHFLGLLKKELDPVVRKHVSSFVAKDLTRVNEHELMGHLTEVFHTKGVRPNDQQE